MMSAPVRPVVPRSEVGPPCAIQVSVVVRLMAGFSAVPIRDPEAPIICAETHFCVSELEFTLASTSRRNPVMMWAGSKGVSPKAKFCAYRYRDW